MKAYMTTYYAHSKRIYNTDREKKERAWIEKKFGNPYNKLAIVCPNRDMGELGRIEPYLRQISNAHQVVCSEYQGHVGKGVFEEVKHALKLGLQVYCLRKGWFGFKLKKVKGVDIVNERDWGVYYGRIIV